MCLDKLSLYPICETYSIFIMKLIWTPKNYFDIQSPEFICLIGTMHLYFSYLP